MGEWIEIWTILGRSLPLKVSPFMGEWIEISVVVLPFGAEACLIRHG